MPNSNKLAWKEKIKRMRKFDEKKSKEGNMTSIFFSFLPSILSDRIAMIAIT